MTDPLSCSWLHDASATSETAARPARNQDWLADPRHSRLVTAIDNDKLQQFLGKFVGDLGATVAVGNVVIGHNLGLYKVPTQGVRVGARWKRPNQAVDLRCWDACNQPRNRNQPHKWD